MTITTTPTTTTTTTTPIVPSGATARADAFRTLYKIGGILAVIQIALIPVAMIVFIGSPPPKTTAEFFALYERSAFLGLLSLDLVYMITLMLVAVMFLALCAALRKASPTMSAVSLLLMVISTAAYLPSNTAFEMWTLSNQYAAATTEAQRVALLGAGDAMLAIYTGSAFNMSYELAAIAGLLVAFTMWKSNVFSKLTAGLGIACNVLGLVPSSAGTVGLVAAIVFLLPYIIWLPLVARRLLQLGNGAPLELPEAKPMRAFSSLARLRAGVMRRSA